MRSVPALLALLLVLAAPAGAQTRLSLLGGGLVPFGDLDDTSDPSVRFGLRAEHQPVNVLGQRSLLSFHATFAYSLLTLDSEYERIVDAAGADSDSYLLEVSGGVRAYSKAAPFFVTGSAGYARFRPGGDADSVDGVDMAAGLGFLVPTSLAILEVEGAIHQVFAADDVSFQYLTVTLGLGLPF
jgi:hypothetical protein